MLDAGTAALAEHAVATAAELLGGADLAVARVDLVTHEGGLVVGELELIEPGLHLEVLPENAAAYAAVVARRLGS